MKCILMKCCTWFDNSPHTRTPLPCMYSNPHKALYGVAPPRRTSCTAFVGAPCTELCEYRYKSELPRQGVQPRQIGRVAVVVDFCPARGAVSAFNQQPKVGAALFLAFAQARFLGAGLVRVGKLDSNRFAGGDAGDRLAAARLCRQLQRRVVVMRFAVALEYAAVLARQAEIVIRLLDFVHRVVAQRPFLPHAVVAAALVIDIAINMTVSGQIKALTKQPGNTDAANLRSPAGKYSNAHRAG